MILGFKKSIKGKPTLFKEKILSCSKIHTIREDKHNRWKENRMIQFCYGVRTKQFEKFAEMFCLGVQRIKITQSSAGIIVKVNDRCLSEREIDNLAYNDGFDSIKDFSNWFNTNFEGVIIHWTGKRY